MKKLIVTLGIVALLVGGAIGVYAGTDKAAADPSNDFISNDFEVSDVLRNEDGKLTAVKFGNDEPTEVQKNQSILRQDVFANMYDKGRPLTMEDVNKWLTMEGITREEVKRVLKVNYQLSSDEVYELIPYWDGKKAVDDNVVKEFELNQ
ncbi:hypothetical protein [Desulfolucanica intricata]|uniref:hypothetical protein n=1 Tax=Desulfolucanica intricata TaxID=1285191 RepID=UPI00082D6772|nr:hypothetical protein [Desulfolucanica intricata]